MSQSVEITGLKKHLEKMTAKLSSMKGRLEASAKNRIAAEERAAVAENLIVIIQDIHWMARRYADGRSSYAPDIFNRRTRELLALGVRLRLPLFARDGMGRSYDGLTAEEAAASEEDMPRSHLQSVQEEEERVAALVRQRDDALKILTEIHNAFWRDTDGGHSAYFGGVMYDRIKKVLGIDRQTVREMDVPPPSS